MDQDSVKLGLLIEAAQTHQKLAQAAIGNLEGVVRDQIQRSLVVGLRTLHEETQVAVESLQRVRRAANVRLTLLPFGMTVIAAAVAIFLAWCVLPTPAEVATLRAQRDELASNIESLSQRGGRADLRRCGAGHLCVRVDLNAPRYGERSDYLVVRGY
ncbi:MAG TPA: hypothetical protein VGI91_11375 [Steroidobacteraceae bacterium]|jgi:hypothetical protein